MRFRLWGTCTTAGNREVNELAVGSRGHIFAEIERETKFEPGFKPFLNSTVGTAMNQDVSFGGTQEIIHNGTTSVEWNATAVQGSWDFSTGTVITLSAGVDQDEALFEEENATPIDMSGFVVLTGAINLTTYSAVNNTLIIELALAGVVQGNTVNLNDFIDTTLIGTAQSFAILLTEFGIASQTVDDVSFRITRSGGPQVAFTLDDLTFQATGTPLVFKVESDPASAFHVHEIRLALADTLAGTVTNGTMPGVVHDQILGVASLATGIGFRSVKNGVTSFAATFNNLGDMIAGGADLRDPHSDGTDTFVTLSIVLPEPIILEGSPTNNF